MANETARTDEESINRRTILRSVGAASAASFVGVSAFSGTAAAAPCFKDFECGDDATYVKFEFVAEDEDDDGVIESDECSFEEETDTGLITIDSYTSKEGEDCEPISVEWSVAGGYTVTKVMAYGGEECKTVENPNPEQSLEPGLEGPSGQTAAISNLQFCVEESEPLECPSGTRSLARYDVTDSKIEFAGGENVVEFSNVVKDNNDAITGFDFASIDGSDSNDEPETLTTVTVEHGSTVETFEVDPDFEVDKQSGSVSVDEPISRVLFCEAVYAQADFSKGDVIEDLCEDQQGSDKISSITWSSYNGQLDGTQGQFDGSWDIGTETVTVNYKPDNYDRKVSLAVYEVDDPVFQDNNNIDFGETRCRQTLIDSDIDESGDQDGTLTADFPSL